MANTNIDALAGVAGTATIFGKQHEVLDANAEEFKLQGQFSDLNHALGIVARLVPTIDPSLLEKLTPKQIGGIYAVAIGAVKDVENEFPNGSGPAPIETAPA